MGIAGFTHSTPYCSTESRRITGEAAACGMKPVWTSWTKPGRVSSAEESAPPGEAACSTTTVSVPASARRIAATSPW
jgi:hypothetical protein